MAIIFPKMSAKKGTRYFDGSSKTGRRIMAANSMTESSVVKEADPKAAEIAEWNAKVQSKKEKRE